MRFALILFAMLGCADESTTPADMSMPLSSCGHPGDNGNSLGVGKYCVLLSDCEGKTNICSSLGNGTVPSADDTYFCTLYPCLKDAGTGQCGENASCVCSTSGGNSGCACTPTSCQN